MSNKVRIEEIDLLRGFAAVCMVLGHSFLRYPVDLTEISWCAAVEHWIFTFHMECFFLVAGFCYYCINYKSYIIKKVKRILIPYVFFGVITLFAKALGGVAVNRSASIGEGITNFIFYGGNYWFLYVIFIIFTIYPFLEKVFNSIPKKIVLTVLLVLVSSLFHLPRMFMLSSTIYHMTFFVIGTICSDVKKKISDKSERKKSVYMIGTTVFSLIAFIVIDNSAEIGSALRFFRAMSMIVFLYALVAILEMVWKKENIIRKLLMWCGFYSLQLYLFNGYIMAATRIVLCNILGINNAFLLVGIIWSSIIIATIVVCKYILPKSQILRLLSGV